MLITNVDKVSSLLFILIGFAQGCLEKLLDNVILFIVLHFLASGRLFLYLVCISHSFAERRKQAGAAE